MKPTGSQRLHAVPMTRDGVNAFIVEHHRHNRPPLQSILRVGAALEDGTLVAVGTAGRPVARLLDDGVTLEVTRVAADGTPNATSFVYRSLARAALALGWQRIITYTQADEGGASLRASGFRIVSQRQARSGWDTPARRRDNGSYSVSDRIRWEAS